MNNWSIWFLLVGCGVFTVSYASLQLNIICSLSSELPSYVQAVNFASCDFKWIIGNASWVLYMVIMVYVWQTRWLSQVDWIRTRLDFPYSLVCSVGRKLIWWIVLDLSTWREASLSLIFLVCLFPGMRRCKLWLTSIWLFDFAWTSVPIF
jgi:hypothetical protein